MGLFSCGKKVKDDSEKLMADVMNKVLPHIEQSVQAHLDDERKKVIESVIAKTQTLLGPSVQPQYVQQQQQQVQQNVPTLSSTAPLSMQASLVASGVGQNPMMQHVLEQMAPYLDESVKRIVDQERDALVGNVVQQIQTNINNKAQ